MLWNGLVLAYLFFFVGMVIGSWLKPFQIRRYWYLLGVLFALGLASFGFRLNPYDQLDLSRLNQLVELMRNTCDTLAEALDPALGDPYTSMTFFRILCFYVSQMPSNGWLPALSIMITVVPLFSVLIDYLRSEKYSTRAILPSLSIIFMGMQMQYVFSGVRNAMAVTLAVAGLYLLFYKRRHRILALLLCAMAITTHQVVLILVPVVLLCWIPKGQLVFRVVMLGAMPIIFFLAEIVQNLPIPLLQTAGLRILYYVDRSYIYDRPEMIANLIMFAAISLGYWLIRWIGRLPPESRGWTCYMNGYTLLGCIMIGCVGRRDFTLRIGYLMGAAAVPVLCRILQRVSGEKNVENRKTVQAVVLMIAFGLAACSVKVFYDTIYVMSQWDFGGV